MIVVMGRHPVCVLSCPTGSGMPSLSIAVNSSTVTAGAVIAMHPPTCTHIADGAVTFPLQALEHFLVLQLPVRPLCIVCVLHLVPHPAGLGRVLLGLMLWQDTRQQYQPAPRSSVRNRWSVCLRHDTKLCAQSHQSCVQCTRARLAGPAVNGEQLLLCAVLCFVVGSWQPMPPVSPAVQC